MLTFLLYRFTNTEIYPFSTEKEYQKLTPGFSPRGPLYRISLAPKVLQIQHCTVYNPYQSSQRPTAVKTVKFRHSPKPEDTEVICN